MSSNTKTTTRRKYQELWLTVKQYKQAAIIPSLSKDPAVFKKFASTVRRAVQKEKYQDTRFRVKYPHAKLESYVIEDELKLVFKLDLGVTLDLNDFTTKD